MSSSMSTAQYSANSQALFINNLHVANIVRHAFELIKIVYNLRCDANSVGNQEHKLQKVR